MSIDYSLLCDIYTTIILIMLPYPYSFNPEIQTELNYYRMKDAISSDNELFKKRNTRQNDFKKKFFD